MNDILPAPAMPAANHTRKLPSEIFSTIFDDLSVSDVLAVSHVNAQWRRTALDHPYFWQHITIKTLSISGIKFFETRLGQGGTRKVKSLRISFPEVCSVFLSTLEVFSLLLDSLHRIEELDIEIHYALAGTLFRQLQTRPAPLLRLFAIHLNYGDGSARKSGVLLSLPDRLFSGTCPLLRTLHISGIATDSPMPVVSRTVTHLRIATHTEVSMPPAWFDAFPHLKELTIWALCWRIQPRALNGRPSSILQRLRRLELLFGKDSYAVMQALSCSHVPHQTWNLAVTQIAVELLPQLNLGGPLRLRMSSDPTDSLIVHLDFESISPDAGGNTLRFVGLRDELELWSYDTYFSPEMLGRLQSLQVDSNLCYMLKRIDRLPALEKLEYNMILSDFPRVLRPFAHLELPKLREIVCYNDGRFAQRLVTNSVDGLL